MTVRVALIFLISITLNGPAAKACSVDQYHVDEIKFSRADIACSPGAGQQSPLPGLVIKGNLNNQQKFTLCVDDVFMSSALLTIMLNPYYGLTEHDMGKVKDTPVFKIESGQSQDIAKSVREALMLLGRNPVFSSVLSSKDRVTQLDALKSAEEVNASLKKLADVLGADIRRLFEENSIMWYPVSIGNLTMLMSSDSGRALGPELKGVSDRLAGGEKYEVFNADGLNDPNFNIVYSSRKIVQALFRTASLGAGGTRGASPPEVTLSAAQNALVGQLAVATKTKSCMVALNLPKKTSPVSPVAEFIKFKFEQHPKGDPNFSDQSKLKTGKSNRAPAQTKRYK